MYEILMKDIIHENADIACCSAIYECRPDEIVSRQLNRELDMTKIIIFNTIDENLMAINGNNYNILKTVWNKIYSKQVIGKLRFDKEAGIADDCKFIIELFSSRDVKCCFRNMKLYYWMQHENNQSKSNNYKNKYRAVKTYEKMISILSEKNIKIVSGIYCDYICLIIWTYSALIRSEDEKNDLLEKELINRLKSSRKFTKFLKHKYLVMYKLITFCPSIAKMLIKLGL